MIDLLDQLTGIGEIAVVKIPPLSYGLKKDAICGPGTRRVGIRHQPPPMLCLRLSFLPAPVFLS
jgi:hypothetical protein